MSAHATEEGVEANEIALWSAVTTAIRRTVKLADPTLAGHCFAVAVYTRDIAAQMNAVPRTQALGFCAGLVHDAGKLGLPLDVVWNDDPLTLDERHLFQTYPERSEHVLMVADYAFTEMMEIVRHQAEWFDGQGYPDRLAGEAIPRLARVLAVANAFSELTMERHSAGADACGLSPEAALALIRDQAGTRFDPDAVDGFDELLAGRQTLTDYVATSMSFRPDGGH